MSREQEPRAIREAVGVFNRSENLQDAINELLSSDLVAERRGPPGAEDITNAAAGPATRSNGPPGHIESAAFCCGPPRRQKSNRSNHGDWRPRTAMDYSQLRSAPKSEG